MLLYIESILPDVFYMTYVRQKLHRHLWCYIKNRINNQLNSYNEAVKCISNCDRHFKSPYYWNSGKIGSKTFELTISKLSKKSGVELKILLKLLKTVQLWQTLSITQTNLFNNDTSVFTLPFIVSSISSYWLSINCYIDDFFFSKIKFQFI